MILSWMLYATLISLFFALAARILETPVRQQGWPTRWLWSGAMLGSVVLPLLAATGIHRRSANSSIDVSPTGEATPPAFLSAPLEWAGTTTDAARMAIPVLVDLDSWLLRFWIAGTLSLLALLVFGYSQLLLRARKWRSQMVDGRALLVSPDTGPAVIGLLDARIVVPEWLLDVDVARRALVLAHEEEHLRAGDPGLLLGMLLVVAAAPWNLPLWWQWQRLRQAVEVDTDLRVLARGVSPRAYGRLLVDVSERGAAHRVVVAALASSSLLERRIQLMNCPSPSILRTAGSVTLALLLIFAACDAVPPQEPTADLQSATPAAQAALAENNLSYDTAPVNRYNPDRLRWIQQTVKEHYPVHLREQGVTGRVVVWAHVTTDGTVGAVRLAESSGNADLDAAALQIIRLFRFDEPAKKDGQPVAAWVKVPFSAV
jgi:bla regulator protein blaR1